MRRVSQSSFGVKFWGNTKWFRKQKVRFSRPGPPTAGFRRIICGSTVRMSKAHFLRTPPFPLHLHLTLSSAQSYVLSCTGEDRGFPEPALPPLGSPPPSLQDPAGPGDGWSRRGVRAAAGLGPAPERINAGRPGRRGHRGPTPRAVGFRTSLRPGRTAASFPLQRWGGLTLKVTSSPGQ